MLSRHTKRALLGFLFAGVALVLIGATTRHYFAARALELRLGQEKAKLVAAEPLLLVVERSDRSRERSYAVRLQPFQRTSVAAEIAGRVGEVLVETGDSVQKGDLLLRLDATLARLNVEAAQAALGAGEAQLRELARRVREAERLVAAQTIPETQLEAARSQAEVQERELDRLRAEVGRQQEILARHEVRAPFSGNVNQRLVEEGDSVNQSQALVSLVTLDPLRARFFVSDREVGSFRVGQTLPLGVAAEPGREFWVPVTSVARSTDPGSGLYMVEAQVANGDQRLAGGAQGSIRATIIQYSDTLFVPASAVAFEGRRTMVEVWKEGSVTARDIRIGAETEGYYPVVSGLEEGDVLVVR
jgi:RND family efflux transporter MFP subunit